MRRILVALAAACSAPATPPPAPITVVPRAMPAVVTHEVVDVVASLAAEPPEDTATIIVGPAQLVLGGMSLEPRETGAIHDVDVLELRGGDVRVGVRSGGVRFAIWTSRTQLLGVLERRYSVGNTLHLEAGVRVHRLDASQFRYIGAVEVEGSSSALGERGRARRRPVRQPFMGKSHLFIAGAVIRSEPRTFATQLAVLHVSMPLDVVKQLDDGWYEVMYRDTDVSVRGFISRRAPPARTHRRPTEEPMPLIATNATVAPGTCLFVDGDPIGFVDAQLAAHLAPARAGWFTLTIDTPWGPTTFEAKGPIDTQLETCP